MAERVNNGNNQKTHRVKKNDNTWTQVKPKYYAGVLVIVTLTVLTWIINQIGKNSKNYVTVEVRGRFSCNGKPIINENCMHAHIYPRLKLKKGETKSYSFQNYAPSGCWPQKFFGHHCSKNEIDAKGNFKYQVRIEKGKIPEEYMIFVPINLHNPILNVNESYNYVALPDKIFNEHEELIALEAKINACYLPTGLEFKQSTSVQIKESDVTFPSYPRLVLSRNKDTPDAIKSYAPRAVYFVQPLKGSHRIMEVIIIED
jgi:hypothetical protein